MIEKPVEQINARDIEELVSNNVIERRTLEYKAVLPDNSDSGKKEFLADVSSFANTIGGDLIYGVNEQNGNLDINFGLTVNDIDSDIARLENMVRDGISPRFPIDVMAVQLPDSKFVLVIRVRSSLEAPHRVIYKAHDKFYARNSNGKYSMDVLELRASFAKTGAIANQIENFRTSRILDLKSDGELTTSFPFIAVHLIPLSAFSSSFRIDSGGLLQLREGDFTFFRPFYAGSWSYRINLSGVVAYTYEGREQKICVYTQFYREGIVEGVDGYLLSSYGDNKLLPIRAIEERMLEYTTNNLTLLRQFGFQPPVYIFLSLGNVRGYGVEIPERYWTASVERITNNDLILPEAIINSYDDAVTSKLRPVFDLIWNAAGLSKSLSFDADDNFLK